VVVLGDLGRSPRMQYHALALAGRGVAVDIVAYAGHPAYPELARSPLITCHLMVPPRLRAWPRLPRALFVPAALIDLAIGSLDLLRRLLAAGRPDLILVQNPPSVPTLAVALIGARARTARLVVDWHNLAWTMLALRLGRGHPVVRLARWYERALARRADAHLCVSGAMRAELTDRWQLGSVTLLRDRPAARFASASNEERRATLLRLCAELAVPTAAALPALLVNPTSWTADEDFDLLLDALGRCESRLDTHLLVVLTGDGPRKAKYERRIAGIGWRCVHVRTLWVAAEEYPALVASADLGLCLHRSSSGLDLPMKVADLLGAGVPVCALDYGPCVREMVRHGENGLLVRDAKALAAALIELFAGFPTRTPLLDRLRRTVASSPGLTWEEGWLREAWPVLSGS
jgi:beta-1,4-mannosyltransferase